MKITFTTSTLLFLALLCGALCSAHNCNHDDLNFAPIRMQASPDSSVIEAFNFSWTNPTPKKKIYQPLRITPEYSGISHLSGAQQKFVKEILVPRALARLMDVFSIIREDDTIYFTEYYCLSAMVPLQYVRKKIDTDLMIFVTAEKDDPGVLASAAACFLHRITDRPIGGAIFLNTVNLFTEVETWEEQINTLVHELLHVLGVSRWLFQYYHTSGSVTRDTVKRGMPTKIIVTPKVVEVAREYYNCPTLDGIELENEGGAGSKGSHFERRVLGDELMTASSVSSPKLSIFTLALLEDSGWYKANYSNADQLTFGRSRGCDFIEKTCIDKATKQPRFPEFCGVHGQASCSLDHRELGTCLRVPRANLSWAFNYFGDGEAGWDDYADGCPTLLPSRNNDCTKKNSEMSGTKGSQSRCFDYSYFFSFDKHKCMNHKCQYHTNGTTTLSFESDGKHYNCPQAGGTAKIPGLFSTSVFCPPAEKICTEGIRMSAFENEKTGKIQYALHSIYEYFEDIFGYTK